MIKPLILFFLVLNSLYSVSQTDTFSISGQVVDAETGEGIPFATVQLSYENKILQTIASDFEGNFIFKSLYNNTYTIRFSFVGYQKTIIEGVPTTIQNELNIKIHALNGIECIETYIIYSPPLLSPFGSGSTWTKEEISRMPYR